METNFRTKTVKVDIPVDCNVIFGHSHFIKTVEDLYEALVTSSSSIKFGIAFFLGVVNRLCIARSLTKVAATGLKVEAIACIDHGQVRDRLGKLEVDGFAARQPLFKLGGDRLEFAAADPVVLDRLRWADGAA